MGSLAFAQQQGVAPGYNECDLQPKQLVGNGEASTILTSRVSIIRRNVRAGKYDVAQVVQRLLTKIPKDEALPSQT